MQVPTFRADPLTPACDAWCEFPVSDRPNAVRQFMDAAVRDPSMIKVPPRCAGRHAQRVNSVCMQTPPAPSYRKHRLQWSCAACLSSNVPVLVAVCRKTAQRRCRFWQLCDPRCDVAVAGGGGDSGGWTMVSLTVGSLPGRRRPGC